MSTTEYRVTMLAVEEQLDLHTEDWSIAFTFVNEEQHLAWFTTQQEAQDFLDDVDDKLPEASPLLRLDSRECTDWTPVV